MKFTRLSILAVALPLALSTIAAGQSVQLPPAKGMMFWTQDQKLVGYRNMEKIFPNHVVKRGDAVFALPRADAPLDVSYDENGKHWSVDDFMAVASVAGLLVIKDGKIVLERYGLGETQDDRWTSFSVAKSLTSTLVGAAIKDGYISSLDAHVTDYLPALKGSAYDGVTLRELLTMSSGVKWNEDYADPNSDVNLSGIQPLPSNGEDPVVAYMAKLPRADAPGTKFLYKTGESDLIGILVTQATHKTLAEYLSEKIWAPYGMEKNAIWMIDGAGKEYGGCCLSMTLRDYGRFALFILNGGVAGGKEVLPENWISQATTTQVSTGRSGYGYQWWTYPDGSYEAIGIFGQSIYIVPKENLVIVVSSAWPKPGYAEGYRAHAIFYDAVRKALR